ncbi:MAG: caspase family protein, partial [Methylococcales bacterium]
ATQGTNLNNYQWSSTPPGASTPLTWTGLISPALLSISSVGNLTKVYDGTTTATLTPANFSTPMGFVSGQGASVTNNVVGAYNTADAQTPNAVTATLKMSDLTATQGTNLNNYQWSSTPPGSSTTLTWSGSISATPGTDPTTSIQSSVNSNNARFIQTIFAEPTNNTSSRSKSSVTDVNDNFYGNVVNSPSLLSGLINRNQLYFPTLEVKNSAGRVKRIMVSRNKQFVSLLFEDGSVRVWDLQRGIQRLVFDPHNRLGVSDFSAVNEKDESLAIATHSDIAPYDINTSVMDDKALIKEPGISHFARSNDAGLLLMNLGTHDLSTWDSLQNKKLWQTVEQRGAISNLVISDNNEYGAVLSNQLESYALPSDLKLTKLTDAIDIIDLKTGKIVKSLPNSGEQVVYMKFKDKETLQVGLADGEVFDWSIASGNKKPAIAFDESIIAMDNAKSNYAYVADDGGVRVIDDQGAIKFNVKNKENPFTDAKWLDEGKKLLTVMEGGELSLWDIPSGKKMLRLFSTPKGWTVMDASGRFDGSENAFENFSWLANNEHIPIDNFSDNYYEPGLLTTVLQNQNAYLNSSPNMVKSGINLPPQVSLKLAEQQTKEDSVAVQVDVFGRGGEIDKVNVYHNGRLMETAGHIVSQQQSNVDDGEHRTIILNVRPSAGKNTVKVIASNTMGIENSSNEVSFDGKSNPNASFIRVVSVGIDKYRDSKLDLDYSVADAGAIKNSLEKSSSSIMGKNIYNERATKQQILDELKTLSKGVQEDVLVIYFAGHGIAVGKEWYFLPYETQIQPDINKVISSGISSTELGDIFKNSEIQHIMLMVDACYSGAAMDAFRKSENTQRYFTRKLSRNLGITVVAAAAKDQEAFELKSLGHGLFTYLVTKDLQDKAGKEAVSAHDLADNIVKTLPTLAKSMVGSSQEPVAYTRGDDFMITDLGKEPK